MKINSIERVGVIAALALAQVLVAELFAEDANLLPVSFESDNAGGYLGWECDGVSRRLPERGPDGGVALRFVNSGVAFKFGHERRKLAPGGKYRLSANVRTHRVTGPARVELAIHRWPWNDSARAEIPADTTGAWQKVSCAWTLPPSSKDQYGVLLYGSGALPDDATLDIADLRLVALDETAKAGASPIPDEWPFALRVSPVDPSLADLDPRAVKILFYYPGPRAGADGKPTFLRATLAGKAVSSAFGADGFATADFGAIPAGRHPLAVEAVTDGAVAVSNRYTAIAREPVPDPTPLKRLNNLVSEILNVPLADGEVAFTLAKDGIVWVGADRELDGVEADLDDLKRVLHHRPRELGAPRHVGAGRHVVRVRGVTDAAKGARLVVRLMKPIFFGASFTSATLEDKSSRRYNRYFYNEDYLTRMNLFGTYTEMYGGGGRRVCKPFRDYAAEPMADRGVRLGGKIGAGAHDPIRSDLRKLTEFYTMNPLCRAGIPFSNDEVGITSPKREKATNTEAMWALCETGVPMHSWFEDSKHGCFNRPGLDIPELSAYINIGEGRSTIHHEWYARAPIDAEEYDETVRFMRRQLKSLRACVPSAPAHLCYYIGGFESLGYWTSAVYPHVDMKAFDARMMHLVATDPDFADIAGIGLGGAFCDEDYLRSMFTAANHYAVEGRTDDYCARHGLRMFPDHLKNGDFENGFEGWRVEAAEPDAVTLGSEKGFGHAVERRQAHFYKKGNRAVGDTFAQLTRSAKGPNKLVQRLRGLKKGELYQVVFATADLDEVRHPSGIAVPPRPGFSASVKGAKEIPELAYVGACNNIQTGANPFVHQHRIVFRANGPKAVLTLSDWLDAKRAGGRIGGTTLLNYVGCRRYFLRDESDLEYLKDYFRDRGK